MAAPNGFNPEFAGPVKAGAVIPFLQAGSATTAILLSSDSGSFGIYLSAGTPAFAAAKGSLALNTAATASSHRLFINTGGAWSGIASLS